MPLLTQGLGRKLQATRKGITGLLADGAASEAYGLLGGIYPASGPSLKRGVKDILDGYSEMPWLRAVAGKVATEVASTCWYLYKPSNRERSRSLRIVQRAYGDTRHRLVKRNMQDGAFEAVDDHVLLTALSNANSFLVGHNLFHLTQIHLDLAGEAFWIKERNRLGVPVGFWPIPPSWVKSTPSISKPWFDVQWSGWKGKIPHTEIVWYVDPNPADPYGRGSGLALTLADELETDEYAARHTKMVFLNRARPDLIVWPEESKFDSGTISDANARRLGEMWRAEHQGFWRTALPFFSTRKLGVKELGQSMRDLAVTDLRKHERDMIVQVWGMPPEEMGIIENSNRSTIEAADFLFKRNVIVPRLERLRAYMQERLIPEYDDRLVIEYDSPVEADRDRHMKAAETAPWALTVDEWREMAGHDPLPDDGGKFHMVDLRTQPRPDLRYEAPPVTLAGNPSLTGEVQDEADDDDDDESAAGTRSVKRSMSRRVRALTDDPDDLPELSRRWASREPAVRRSLEDGFVRLREDTTLADVQRLIESGSPPGAGGVVARGGGGPPRGPV
ncbi:MAG: phage portal protein, partial [Rhodospirillaceae bacterium]